MMTSALQNKSEAERLTQNAQNKSRKSAHKERDLALFTGVLALASFVHFV